MKKILGFVFVAGLLASCTETVSETDGNASVNETYAGHVISAEIAVPTKTSLGAEEDGMFPVVWSEGDEIAAIENKGADQKVSVYRLQGQGGESTGTFEYVSGDADPANIRDLVYPASAVETSSVPAEQVYVAGSFDPAAALMSWHSDEGLASGVVFSHDYSVICLQLDGDESISSIKATVDGKEYTVNCAEPVALPQAFHIAVAGSDEAVNASFFMTSADGSKAMQKAPSKAQAYPAGSVVRFPEFTYSPSTVYEVLDYYPVPDDASTAEGIVFSVSDGGLHGLVISAKEYKGSWGPRVSEQQTTGNNAMREDPEPDGKLATSNLIKAHQSEAGFETNYPGFYWLLNTMNGGDVEGDWYVPSRPEIAEFYCAISGLDWADVLDGGWSYTTEKKSIPGYDSDEAIAARKAFEDKIEAAKDASDFVLTGKISPAYETADGANLWNFYYEDSTSGDGGQFRASDSKTNDYNRIRPVKQF